MNLIPLRDDLFFPLEATFDKFFQDFFNSKSNLNVAKSNQGYPKANVYEDDNHFKMVFSVPGLKEDNLELEYRNDNTVTIRGKMSNEHSTPNSAKYYLRELRTSTFERILLLPDNVQGEPQSAELSNGLLTLTWSLKPKKNESVKKISIKKPQDQLDSH